MPLRLIRGRAGFGKTTFCLEEIRQEIIKSPQGFPLIYLVPEQETLTMERMLLADPDIKGFLRVKVLGFLGLGKMLLTNQGQKPSLSYLERKWLLKEIVLENRQKLKLFQSTPLKSGFLDYLDKIIQEFKNCYVTSEEVTIAAVKAAKVKGDLPLLQDKLHDISLIYQKLQERIAGKYLDTDTYFNLLVSQIKCSSLPLETRIWIDGFHWFTAQEYRIIEALVEKVGQVTLTLSSSQVESPAVEGSQDLFYFPKKTREEIMSRVGDLQEEIELTTPHRFAHSSLLKQLEQFYVTDSWEKSEKDKDDIVLVQAANPQAELEGAARDIMRLVHSGYRYRDIMVIVRDLQLYSYSLEKVFSQHKIPFFLGEGLPLLYHPLVDLVKGIFALLDEKNWNHYQVFKLLKTGFFSELDLDRLENYVLALAIKGQKWQEEWSLTTKNFSLADLRQINEDRSRIVELHNKFTGQIRKANDAKEINQAVSDLLTCLKVGERIDSYPYGEEVYSALNELLFLLEKSLGEKTDILEDYFDQLADGLNNLSSGSKKPGLDQVLVVSLDSLRNISAKAVYLLGVNQGILPKSVGLQGIFTDAEKRQLKDWRIELGPNSREEIAQEQLIVYTALTRAKNYLWISCSLNDQRGKGATPSLVFKRLAKLLGENRVKKLTLESLEEVYSYLGCPEQSISLLGNIMGAYKQGRSIDQDWWAVYDWLREQEEWQSSLEILLEGLFYENKVEELSSETAWQLYRQEDYLPADISSLETYRSCPFKYFLNKGLRLQEREKYQFSSRELGTFLHALLERIWGKVSQAVGEDKEKMKLAVEKNEHLSWCQEITDQLILETAKGVLNSSQARRNMTTRLQERIGYVVKVLLEFVSVSQFSPVALEKKYSLYKKLSNGKKMKLTAKIDRLDMDRDKKYALIIDYKSKGQSLDILKVYHGLQLQLLTYLAMALELNQPCSPGAVLYANLTRPWINLDSLSAKDKVESNRRGKTKMDGWILADLNVVRMIEPVESGYCNFLKIGVKKEGEFYSNTLGSLRSEKEFSAFLNHLDKLLKETAEDILQGKIGIEPYWLKGAIPCNFCEYKPICGFDRLINEKSFRKLEILENRELLARVCEGGGMKDELNS